MPQVGQARLVEKTFTVPTFSGAVIVNLVSVFSLVGFLYFLTQHLQLVIGLSPLNAALMLIPGVVIIIVTGLLAVPLVRIVRPGFVMAAGLSLCFIAYAMTAIIGSGSSASVCSSNIGLLVSGSKPVCTRRVSTSPLACAPTTLSL